MSRHIRMTDGLGQAFSAIDAGQDNPPLDPWRFDDMVKPDRKLWGLQNIARCTGLSISVIRRLATVPDVPIYHPKGSKMYFAFRNEVLEWMRSTG